MLTVTARASRYVGIAFFQKCTVNTGSIFSINFQVASPAGFGNIETRNLRLQIDGSMNIMITVAVLAHRGLCFAGRSRLTVDAVPIIFIKGCIRCTNRITLIVTLGTIYSFNISAVWDLNNISVAFFTTAIRMN